MQIVIDIPEVFYEYCKAQEDAIEIQLAIKNGTPLDDLIAELGRCKTWHEMQLSERDTKGKLMISDIFCHIIEIINGYTTDKAESEEKA